MTPRAWLAPLGALFGGAALVRSALYTRGLLSPVRLRGPVISVGNLRLGGTGKTTLVARLAEILVAEGLPVAVLSRGYRGSFRGDFLVVGDGREVLAQAALAGDEPVMLARSLPGVVVAVGARRDRVGRAVEERFGRRVHILDDGFQHLRLARDLDLLCADPADLEGRPVPAGWLREFPSAQRRADLVLLSEALPDVRARELGSDRLFLVGREVQGFFDLAGRLQPAPRRPFLLAGIARPERFTADVRSRVPLLAGVASFPDHHPYTEAEIRALEARAQAGGADAIVTTAKDAVRLPAALAVLPVLVLKIRAAIQDEGRFRQKVLAVARRAA